MRGIASTPTTVPKATFFCELARLYASKFKNVKKQKLSGPWIDFMDCMHGKLAISMLDGYKAVRPTFAILSLKLTLRQFIDNSAATNKPGSAELRNTARRLMAMLAHNTQMLPSGLEIPEKLIGKEEPRKPRAEGEAGMDVDGPDGASGSYGDVMFTMMKCRRRGTDIRVAIKSIKASATPEEIKVIVRIVYTDSLVPDLVRSIRTWRLSAVGRCVTLACSPQRASPTATGRLISSVSTWRAGLRGSM